MTLATSARLERLLPSERTFFDEPAWMQAERVQAQAWLAANGLPDARDEAWKYTALDDILAAICDAAPVPPRPAHGTDALDELAGDHGGPRLVFVNGAFAPNLSRTALAPAGVVVGNGVALADSDRAFERSSAASSRFDGLEALNRVAGHDAAVLRIAPDTVVDPPIHVVHLSVPGVTPSASHPRTLIEVGAAARVTVIETYAGQVDRHLTNAGTTIAVGCGAEVSQYKVQMEGADSFHVAHTSIVQEGGSEVRTCTVMLGAAIARNAVDIVLAGDGARLEVAGLYLPTGRQRHDNVVTVEHAASACTSRQVFKGVVDDHARGSFSGRILVRPHTVATDAGQTSRSLLLSPTAQADTRPWLEIRSDDVRCTHGATIGRLDANALFYLRTRGIEPNDARAMLVEAFINEITDAIGPETLRSQLQAATAERLSSTRLGLARSCEGAQETTA
jgi:Fe-S cluster assembly protein SufD